LVIAWGNMFKTVVIFAALAAIAFGKLFVPAKVPCAYHDRADDFEDWVMLSSPSEGYVKIIYGDNVDYIRCDIKQDGKCLYMEKKNGQCTYYFMDNSKYYLNMNFQYYYHGDAFVYDKAVQLDACPVPPGGKGTSKNCRNLTTDDDYVVVDDQDRIVVTRFIKGYDQHFVLEYIDDEFDVSIFNTKDCDGVDLPPVTPVCPAPAPAPVGPSTTSNPSESGSSVVAVSAIVVAVAIAFLVALF